jgi:D-sedoheptulose 7-phosphate isomerase
MPEAFADLVARRLDEAARLHTECRSAAAPAAAAAAAEAMLTSIRGGGKVLVCGNGGSASDAQHFAAELVGRFQINRPAMASLALTTDTSILTAIANDFSYDEVFSRQVEALGAPGDVLLGISTSGESPSVLAAFALAKARAIVTVALTGRDGGALGAAADIHVNVPSVSTARVQEVHRTLMHAICELVERELYG